MVVAGVAAVVVGSDVAGVEDVVDVLGAADLDRSDPLQATSTNWLRVAAKKDRRFKIVRASKRRSGASGRAMVSAAYT